MVIRKRNIILGVLIMLLMVFTVYDYIGNYRDKITSSEKAKQTLEQSITNTNVSQSSSENIFSSFKLERERIRSQSIDTLKELINNSNSDKELKLQAQKEMMNLVKLTEKEMVIENLIKAKGFNDALVFIHENNVNVIVDAQNLTTAQVAQIQDIVSRETGVSIENIKIMQRN